MTECTCSEGWKLRNDGHNEDCPLTRTRFPCPLALCFANDCKSNPCHTCPSRPDEQRRAEQPLSAGMSGYQTIPTLPQGARGPFAVNCDTGAWYYLNHARTWQTMPNPIKGPKT